MVAAIVKLKMGKNLALFGEYALHILQIILVSFTLQIREST